MISCESLLPVENFDQSADRRFSQLTLAVRQDLGDVKEDLQGVISDAAVR